MCCGNCIPHGVVGQFEFSLACGPSEGRNRDMNSAERFAAIRARLQKSKPAIVHKPKGLHVAATGGEPSKPKKDYASGWDTWRAFPLNGYKGDPRKLSVMAEYLREPDLKTSASFKEPLRHGPHPLTKIAESWKSLKKQQNRHESPKALGDRRR